MPDETTLFGSAPRDPDDAAGCRGVASPAKEVERQTPGRQRECQLLYVPDTDVTGTAEIDLRARSRHHTVPTELAVGRLDQSLPDWRGEALPTATHVECWMLPRDKLFRVTRAVGLAEGARFACGRPGDRREQGRIANAYRSRLEARDVADDRGAFVSDEIEIPLGKREHVVWLRLGWKLQKSDPRDDPA